MTVDDCAKLAGVHPSVIRQWIYKGLLRAERRQLGKRHHHATRVSRDDYDRFVAAQQEGNSVRPPMTMGDIATVEGVTEDTVKKWIRGGLLAAERRPAATNPDRYRTTIEPAEYERFVQERRKEL